MLGICEINGLRGANHPMKKNIDSIKMAVVGVGYFGKVHCEKIATLPGVELAAVVDIDLARSRQVGDIYGAEPLYNHLDLNGKVDAVVVAAPSSTHYGVAKDLLASGLNLLVEKPLATTVDHAQHLCDMADRSQLQLQVGHLERFNPIFQKALPAIKDPHYIRMERIGPYTGRGFDVDVILELMTHDLDLLLQMTSSPVQSVSAYGWPVVTSNADVVSARIQFRDGLVADIMASRVSSNKSRRFCVLNEKSFLEVDLSKCQIWSISRSGKWPKVDSVTVEPTDALLEQDRAFVQVLKEKKPPAVCGKAGRNAVELAERLRESMITTKSIPSKMRFAL